NMMELQPRKDGISNTLTTVEKDNWLAEPRMLGHVDIKGNDSIKRTYSTEGISPTLTTMGGGHREPKIAVLGNVSNTRHNNENVHDKDGISPTITARDYKGAKLVAEAQEWWGEQESVQDEWKTEACIRRKVKVLDMTDEQKELMAKWEKDAVIRKSTCSECGIIYDVDDGCLCEEEVRPVLTPDRMEKRQNGRRFKEDGEESFTLTSQDKHGVAIGNPPKYRIRKLTPLECWRLQGFPDETHEAVKQAGISDSQRYRQAGNAITVQVVEALGKKLLEMGLF